MQTARFWRGLIWALAAIPAMAADKGPHLDFNIPLWPDGKVPGAKGDWSVDKPYLTAVLPPEGQGNGAAAIILPGGGNVDLFAHQEGMAVAEHMNDWGVAAFVLTYRLSPRYAQDARILDGRRAVQLLRSRAAELKLDPKRIGMAGFSAGGNLIRPLAASPVAGDPAAADPVDRVSSRPDFAIMVYGSGRAAANESLKDYPPTFLIAAAADSTSTGSAELFLDLKKAGVSAELHLYQRGRHGFGAGEGQPILGDWMGRCQSWMKNAGLLGAAKPAGPLSLAPTAAVQTVNDGYGDYVLVPAGAFKMGDNFDEGDARERPVHTVELDAFYIGKFEVTNAEYGKFRADPGYDDPKLWPGGVVVSKEISSNWTTNRLGGGTAGNEGYAVMGVTWEQAVAYCNWVSARTGKKYRLPTEAEWEKAARGTGQRRYPWGNEIDPSVASYAERPMMPAGAYRNASPYGAYDMAGALFEWCSDWYSRNYYSFSPRRNPPGPPAGANRVLRGGSQYLDRWDMRAAARSSGAPSNQGHKLIGFRAVRER